MKNNLTILLNQQSIPVNNWKRYELEAKNRYRWDKKELRGTTYTWQRHSFTENSASYDYREYTDKSFVYVQSYGQKLLCQIPLFPPYNLEGPYQIDGKYIVFNPVYDWTNINSLTGMDKTQRYYLGNIQDYPTTIYSQLLQYVALKNIYLDIGDLYVMSKQEFMNLIKIAGTWTSAEKTKALACMISNEANTGHYGITFVDDPDFDDIVLREYKADMRALLDHYHVTWDYLKQNLLVKGISQVSNVCYGIPAFDDSGDTYECYNWSKFVQADTENKIYHNYSTAADDDYILLRAPHNTYFIEEIYRVIPNTATKENSATTNLFPLILNVQTNYPYANYLVDKCVGIAYKDYGSSSVRYHWIDTNYDDEYAQSHSMQSSYNYIININYYNHMYIEDLGTIQASSYTGKRYSSGVEDQGLSFIYENTYSKDVTINPVYTTVSSTNRNAYPDNGEVDTYWYVFTPSQNRYVWNMRNIGAATGRYYNEGDLYKIVAKPYVSVNYETNSTTLGLDYYNVVASSSSSSTDVLINHATTADAIPVILAKNPVYDTTDTNYVMTVNYGDIPTRVGTYDRYTCVHNVAALNNPPADTKDLGDYIRQGYKWIAIYHGGTGTNQRTNWAYIGYNTGLTYYKNGSNYYCRIINAMLTVMSYYSTETKTPKVGNNGKIVEASTQFTNYTTPVQKNSAYDNTGYITDDLVQSAYVYYSQGEIDTHNYITVDNTPYYYYMTYDEPEYSYTDLGDVGSDDRHGYPDAGIDEHYNLQYRYLRSQEPQYIEGGLYHVDYVYSYNRNAYPDNDTYYQGYYWDYLDATYGMWQGRYIDTVSSYDSNAYPNDGMKLGYWYIPTDTTYTTTIYLTDRDILNGVTYVQELKCDNQNSIIGGVASSTINFTLKNAEVFVKYLSYGDTIVWYSTQIDNTSFTARYFYITSVGRISQNTVPVGAQDLFYQLNDTELTYTIPANETSTQTFQNICQLLHSESGFLRPNLIGDLNDGYRNASTTVNVRDFLSDYAEAIMGCVFTVNNQIQCLRYGNTYSLNEVSDADKFVSLEHSYLVTEPIDGIRVVSNGSISVAEPAAANNYFNIYDNLVVNDCVARSSSPITIPTRIDWTLYNINGNGSALNPRRNCILKLLTATTPRNRKLPSVINTGEYSGYSNDQIYKVGDNIKITYKNGDTDYLCVTKVTISPTGCQLECETIYGNFGG